MTDVRRLARNVAVDISVDGTTWLNLPGRTDTNPNIVPNKVDSSDFDNGGYASSEVTQQAGTVSVKYNSLANGGTPNPAQELVEACIGQFGDSARLYVRWYDTDGGSRAFSGRAIVEVAFSATGVQALREVTVTFTMDGAITKITNPYAANVKPVVLSATPSGAAAGDQVKITGQHFKDGGVDATAVKFGATSATEFMVLSDSLIVAVMPAGTAGSAAVTVTNATGTSDPLAYTRGA